MNVSMFLLKIYITDFEWKHNGRTFRRIVSFNQISGYEENFRKLKFPVT